MTERPASTSPTSPKTGRWAQCAVWIGLVVTLFGVLSYFMYFAQFPNLRDIPYVNLPIVFCGLILAGSGCLVVLARGQGALRKTLAIVGFLLSLVLAGLFDFYVFSLSYQLPESPEAATTEKPAPDFMLLDQKERPVRLSGFRGTKVVLVFYRGHW